MGSTASAVLIEGNQMAVCPMLATLVFTCFITGFGPHYSTQTRLRAIDSGQITADEGAYTPSRSVVAARKL